MSLTLNSQKGLINFKNLHCFPEVSNRDSHGAVFVNIPKEIPESQLALIQIVLQKHWEKTIMK